MNPFIFNFIIYLLEKQNTKLLDTRGVHGVVWCGFESFLAPHFAVRFS